MNTGTTEAVITPARVGCFKSGGGHLPLSASSWGKRRAVRHFKRKARMCKCFHVGR